MCVLMKQHNKKQGSLLSDGLHLEEYRKSYNQHAMAFTTHFNIIIF